MGFKGLTTSAVIPYKYNKYIVSIDTNKEECVTLCVIERERIVIQ